MGNGGVACRRAILISFPRIASKISIPILFSSCQISVSTRRPHQLIFEAPSSPTPQVRITVLDLHSRWPRYPRSRLVYGPIPAAKMAEKIYVTYNDVRGPTATYLCLPPRSSCRGRSAAPLADLVRAVCRVSRSTTSAKSPPSTFSQTSNHS